MFANLKNHKNKDVVFIKDSTSVGNNLEMCPSNKNESFMAVVVDKYFDHLRGIMVRSVRNKWKIIWLQMRKQLKHPRRRTGTLRDSTKMEDILKKSSSRLESGGRITFYSNTAKNGSM